MKQLIQDLPTKSGIYLLQISRFNEQPFEKKVEYSYERGVWIDPQSTEILGHADQLIHNAEWHDIHSFTEDDKFDVSH